MRRPPPREDLPDRPEPLVSVEEAAAFLGVRPGTVYLWAETGRIPSYKIGARRRFRLSELDAHLRAYREGPDGARRGEWSLGDGIITDVER
jgi:excisionase family DNA binding protein